MLYIMLYITLGTTEGDIIHIKSISIEPCVSASVTYSIHTKGGNEELTLKIEGEQYKRWGTDDTIIYHILCAKHNLHYKPYVEPEFFEEIMVSKDEETGNMIFETIKYPNPKYVAPAP